VEREEEGRFNENQIWVVSGFVKTIDERNVKHILQYMADDKGYHVKGKILLCLYFSIQNFRAFFFQCIYTLFLVFQ
jgi:hypothetical protein